MKNLSAIIIGIGIFIMFLFLILGGGKGTSNISKGTNTSVENTQIKDGVQYITINARGGYSPRISSAKAGIPTKLIMKTEGTFDCSASLVIRSINFQKILPQTGETIIDLGIPLADKPLLGICGMGMYNFQINFS